jgi:hypothetical protein
VVGCSRKGGNKDAGGKGAHSTLGQRLCVRAAMERSAAGCRPAYLARGPGENAIRPVL